MSANQTLIDQLVGKIAPLLRYHRSIRGILHDPPLKLIDHFMDTPGIPLKPHHQLQGKSKETCPNLRQFSGCPITVAVVVPQLQGQRRRCTRNC